MVLFLFNAGRNLLNDERTSSNDERTSSNVVRTSLNDERTSTNVVRTLSNDERTSSNDVRTSTNVERTSLNDERTLTNVVRTLSNDVRTSSNDERTSSNLARSPIKEELFTEKQAGQFNCFETQLSIPQYLQHRFVGLLLGKQFGKGFAVLVNINNNVLGSGNKAVLYAAVAAQRFLVSACMEKTNVLRFVFFQLREEHGILVGFSIVIIVTVARKPSKVNPLIF
jgi:hypothetical protein